jgi:hypothetical protein
MGCCWAAASGFDVQDDSVPLLCAMTDGSFANELECSTGIHRGAACVYAADTSHFVSFSRS